jgi:hypothetical protein
MNRSELTDALFQGERLGSPTGASRPPSWSNVAHISITAGGDRRSTRHCSKFNPFGLWGPKANWRQTLKKSGPCHAARQGPDLP